MKVEKKVLQAMGPGGSGGLGVWGVGREAEDKNPPGMGPEEERNELVVLFEG